MYKEKTYTHNSPADLLYRRCNNYYAENFCLSDVTLIEFYRHDCRISNFLQKFSPAAGNCRLCE